MSREDDTGAPATPPLQTSPKPGTKAREARLAQALRANLRRRKAAARGEDEGPPEG